MNDFVAVLRKLAKSDYYQSLYSSAKELGFQIFDNNTDLTKIQLWFLSFMGMYNSINLDIAMGEVSERVLENETYEDAYLVYKKKQFSIDMKNSQKQKIESQNSIPKSQWVFKKTKVK